MGFVSTHKALNIPEIFFEFIDGGIDILGFKGFVSFDGKWGFSIPEDARLLFRGAMYSYVPPEISFIQKLLGVVKDDIQKGKGDRISYIRMTNRIAVILFLGGVLLKEHFNLAECLYDGAGYPYIQIPGVFFEERPFRIVIYSEKSPIPGLFEHPFATLDEWGQVIEN